MHSSAPGQMARPARSRRYPADFTFVCPTELGDLADQYDELKSMGVEVYAVSTDTHFTHKAWHDASETIRKIQFPMVGDPTGRISRSFEVMIEDHLIRSAPASADILGGSEAIQLT